MEHIHHATQSAAGASSIWQNLVQYFSEAYFMPHGHCYLWKPGLVYTHVISDFLIGTAYIVISLTLYGLVRKINLKFNRAVICFGVFIGACGWTHYNEIWNLWQSDYWYSAMVKVLTAFASVGTGIYLVKLRNPLLQMAEAAKLSEQRRLDLEALTKDLEQRVEERTKEVFEKEARFRQLADSMTQLAWMADPSGSIYWYNKRWYEYTGTTFEEMKGWGWEKVQHPEHKNRVIDFVKIAWEKPEPFELTFPLKSATGQWRWFLTRAVPLTNPEGQIVDWFGTNTDITDQIETEETLKNALSSRDEFLSVASHELKTPLTTLLIQAQLQKRLVSKRDERAYQKERIDAFVDQSEKLINRLNRIVNDMLDISRVRSGKLDISKMKFDLSSIVEEVLNQMTPQFEEAGYGIPSFSGVKTEGHWDNMRIQQLIINLLTNAIKYGQKKPVEVKIENLGLRARITVRDHGIGIAPDLQSKIFERFERAINSNEVSGLGLGLYISKQIVEAHAGAIWVESEPEKGSTFIVELPITE